MNNWGQIIQLPPLILIQTVSAIDFSWRLGDIFCYFNAHVFCVEWKNLLSFD